MRHRGVISALTLSTLALLLLGATGCKKKQTWSCPRYVQVLRVAPAADDPVVAEVNGQPITAGAVKRRMAESELTARQAVQELVDEELLFQEARRRKLHRDPVVVEAGKRFAIYRMLAATFEKDFTTESIPEADLRRVYDKFSRLHFNRPELRHFGHAYVTRPWFKRGRRWWLHLEKDRVLKRVMTRFAELVNDKKPQTWEAFKALAMGFELGGETVNTQDGTLPRDELRKPFADALWALKKPGEWTGVIATRKWYHVAYLIEIKPARKIPFAEAKPEIAAKLFPGERTKAFTRWVKKLQQSCPIHVKPENLPVGRIGGPPDGP